MRALNSTCFQNQAMMMMDLVIMMMMIIVKFNAHSADVKSNRLYYSN